MAKKKDSIPRPDQQFMDWHDRLLAGVSGPDAATVEVTPAEIAAITAQNADLHEKIPAVGTTAAAAKQAVVAKNLSRRTAEQTARKLSKRVRNHTGYTPVIGEGWGIEGLEDTTDLTNEKPKLNGKALPHSVMEIGFNKSISDGVNIYEKRDPATDFTFLARDTNSPYIDNRPCVVMGKPENRQYRAIYVVGDSEIGLTSDIITLVCLP